MLGVYGSAVLHGAVFGLEFNPLSSLVAAILVAALVGYPSAPRSRLWWAALLLLGAWAIGDSLDLVAGLADGPDAQAWLIEITFVLVSFGVGYLIPASAGAYVGRHVTHGTGWLSAMAVAAMVAGALIVIAPVLSNALALGLP